MHLSFKNSFFYAICLLLSISACHDKEALKQALIERTVKEKIESHQRRKTETCLKETMKEALTIADSVMIQLALSQVDTSLRTIKPTKPARPEIDLPVDTTPIKPLFEDTIIRVKDSLLPIEKPTLIGNDTISNGLK